METGTNIQSHPNFQQKSLVQRIDENNENEIEVNELTEKCQRWLEKCTTNDSIDSCSVYSDSDSSVFTDSTTNSAMDSGLVFKNNGIVMADQFYSDNSVPNGAIIVKENDTSKYDNVSVYKSKKVHIGDVTYINGPVIFTSDNSAISDKRLDVPIIENELVKPYIDSDLVDTHVITRINWLAQPALGDKEYLDGPAKFVIICHTATEEGDTQANNTLLVRLIQTFHIESRKWKDVAYNFLIGSDGLVYEGRGWGIVGSHTRGYNRTSMGIAFIGCFLHHLPPPKSLESAKQLIEYGVKRGSIAEDYTLLAHCQCTAIESPGKSLFEEMKSWKHWDGSIVVPASTFTSPVIIEEPPDEDGPLPNLP